MRTADQLIDALHAAGATLVVEDGKARVRGAKVPEELLAQLKADKAAVLAAWEKRQHIQRDRYGVVPVGEVPHLATREKLTPEQRAAVTGYCFRQPRPVHAFVMARANEYHGAGSAAEDCEWRACVDVLCWQRSLQPVNEALEWLAGIEAAANLTGNSPQISQTDADKPTNQKEQ